MQYMQDGCTYVHRAIQHIWIKYLWLFWTAAKSVLLSVSSSSGLPRWEPATPPHPKLTEHARPRAQWICACVQGMAPACSAFAGKVSGCVCVFARASKAPARAAFATGASTAAAFPTRAWAMTMQRAKVRDPGVDRWSDRKPLLRPLIVLEPRNHELDIRLQPVGFMLVEIHCSMGALNLVRTD